MDCGAKLIKLKDDIHTDWFNLQGEKRSDERDAYLPANLLDAIIDKGTQAINEVHKCSPQSDLLEPLAKLTKAIESKRDVIGVQKRLAGTMYYTFPKQIAHTIIISDINKLANLVHQAGYSFLESRGTYAGCQITEPPESINAGALAYCQGTLELDSRRGHVLSPGNVVEHRPGAARSHAAVIKFTEAEKGYGVKLDYTESGDKNWELRQEGVQQFAEQSGLDCKDTLSGLSIKCEGNLEENVIRRLALFISQLKDVDLLPDECIDMAFEFISEQITKLDKEEDKEKIWERPWTRTSEASSVEDCTYGASERWTERQKQEDRDSREARLKEYGNYYFMNGESARKTALRQGCVPNAYYFLKDAFGYERYLKETCNRIKLETEAEYATCLESYDELVEKNTEAAKKLASRCNPKPLIQNIEAEHSGWALKSSLSSFEEVCARATADECLKEIEQAITRDEAGIKPQRLF